MTKKTENTQAKEVAGKGGAAKAATTASVAGNQPKEGTSFLNIKTLNELIQQGGSVTALLSEIKQLRKRIDAVIGNQQQRHLQKTEQEAQRREAEKPTPPPPPEKKTVKTDGHQPDFVQPSEPAAATDRPQSGTERAAADSASAAKTVQAAQQPAPAPAPAEDGRKAAETAKKPTAPPPAPVTKTYTPSYIRGEVIPPPPAPPRPARPPQGGGYGTRPPQSGGFGNRPPQSGGFGNRPPQTGGFGNRPPQSGGFGNRPPQTGGFGARPPAKPGLGRITPTAPPPSPARKVDNKKKDYSKGDERKSLNKRTLIRKGFIVEGLDDDRMGNRKLRSKKQRMSHHIAPKVEKAIITTENLTVKILSEKIGKTAQEIIKQLMTLGIMTNINSVVDFATMELVASELGVEIELKLEQTKESLLEDIFDGEDDELNLVKRPPIVTVMGHVDHGKTSLLDAIRKTSVATGEAGGITQHIGAYSVISGSEKITFLDTPGHEAFTELRRRGANVTDIAILIVAADDGVMPQTVEAINHAKAAKVPILVAINKIDKPGADPEKIRQELSAYDLVPEDWGGDTIMVPISAKRGDGIDKLLEMVLLLAEYHNFRANPAHDAKASVIEAKLDKGKGPVANLVVQKGTLRVGDFVVSGVTCGRVRAMVDDKGRNIKEAPPSTPVSILGFADVPGAGDSVFVVGDEKMAKQVIEERNVRMRNEQLEQGPKATLEDLIGKINEGMLKELNLIIKGDVHGSVEALKISLGKLANDEVRTNIIHGGVGAINKSDIMLAEVSHAIIIGFNVRPDAESRTMAEKSGVEVKLYNIIYEAIEDIEKMVKGMVTPKYRYITLGRAQVRSVFKITGSGMIAGSYVLNGKVVRGAKAKVYRGDEVVHEGIVEGLKRFKDDAKEVAAGFECGISVAGYTDIKENDEIEVMIQEEIKN